MRPGADEAERPAAVGETRLSGAAKPPRLLFEARRAEFSRELPRVESGRPRSLRKLGQIPTDDTGHGRKPTDLPLSASDE